MMREAVNFRVLVINPGSTSTKVAVYEGLQETLAETIKYEGVFLSGYPTVYSQLPFRLADMLALLDARGVKLDSLDFIMARGGALKPMEGGAWQINATMLDDLQNARQGEHASRLAALIAAPL